MAERGYDELARDLAALGRGIDGPTPSDGLEIAVRERVAALPQPGRTVGRWTRIRRAVAGAVGTRRRRIVLVVGAVLLALLAAPPVRAAVVDWFGFGAVRVERDGTDATGPASPPPLLPANSSVSQAAALVGFTVSVPEELGEPDGVEVSADRRRVSMSWRTPEAGVLRLDQFGARLDFSVVKRVPGVGYAAVDGTDALWFEEPHQVALIESDGSEVTQAPRLAGHTLVWQEGSTTLRLEGDVTLPRAVEIAESTIPVG